MKYKWKGGMAMGSKWLWVIIVFLAISNIVLISVLVYNKQNTMVNTSLPVNSTDSFNAPPVENRVRFRDKLQEMGISEEQHQALRKSRHQFKAKAYPLMNALDSLQLVYLDEMQKAKPDSIKIQEMAIKTGEYHQLIKEYSYDHLKEAKRLLNDEQEKMFFDHLRSLPPEFQRGKHKRHRDNN